MKPNGIKLGERAKERKKMWKKWVTKVVKTTIRAKNAYKLYDIVYVCYMRKGFDLCFE